MVREVVAGATERGGKDRAGPHQCDLPASSQSAGGSAPPTVSIASAYQKALNPSGRVTSVILVRLPVRHLIPTSEEGVPKPKYPMCLPLPPGAGQKGSAEAAPTPTGFDNQQRAVAQSVCEVFTKVQERKYYSG
ncbi:unnamed protein product, partial [Amoebophrya sp. A25]|eukprot:GSA25T00006272001.1